MLWIITGSDSPTVSDARGCVRISKRSIPRIGTEYTVPNRSEIDEGDVERWVLCAELCEAVIDGLNPCLTPGALSTTAIHVGNEEILGICGRAGKEGHLTKEVLGCLREVIAVDW